MAKSAVFDSILFVVVFLLIKKYSIFQDVLGLPCLPFSAVM